MKFLRLALFSGLATQSLCEVLTADKAEADITTNELKSILTSLYKIAKDNGGNRAYGRPGYNASMDYVLDRAVKKYGDYMDTYIQKFTHRTSRTEDVTIRDADGKKVPNQMVEFNTATLEPQGITAELADLPVDDARGSGCFADQWQGINVKSKIALIKNGGCSVAEKAQLAMASGAQAVILYEDASEMRLSHESSSSDAHTLDATTQGKLIPVGLVSEEHANNWKTQLAGDKPMEVNMIVNTAVAAKDSWNIISETKQGNADSVVMLGAHLDSVAAGPGINDNGSGSAALLTIMGSLVKYTGIQNKVRFAWWGAEEQGLIGSKYYTNDLTSAEADQIKFYMNFDMIGSPNPKFDVYTDNDRHMFGAKYLYEYLKSVGQNATYAKFKRSSDYVGFLNIGIASSGLNTGAGNPWDPNYHTAKDDLNNVNWDAITVNAKAAARAAAELALTNEEFPAREV